MREGLFGGEAFPHPVTLARLPSVPSTNAEAKRTPGPGVISKRKTAKLKTIISDISICQGTP
jgi:hypothetical protein